MDAKAAARARLQGIRDQLVELSHRIHANPELAFEEEKASDARVAGMPEAEITAAWNRDDRDSVVAAAIRVR